jgi:hypothetical protein
VVALAFRASVRARGTGSRPRAVRAGRRAVGFPPATFLVCTFLWAVLTPAALFFLEDVFAASAVLVVVRSGTTQVYPTSELGTRRIQGALPWWVAWVLAVDATLMNARVLYGCPILQPDGA